jgi:hypothetical protein
MKSPTNRSAGQYFGEGVENLDVLFHLRKLFMNKKSFDCVDFGRAFRFFSAEPQK